MNRQIWVLIVLLSFHSFAQFGDSTNNYTLEELIDQASKESPYSLRIKAEQRQANGEYIQNISVLFPSIDISSGFNQTWPREQLITSSLQSPDIIYPNVNTTFLPNTNFQTSIFLTQSILNFQSIHQFKQARLLKQAAQYEYSAGMADFIFNVKQSFYNLLLAYKNFSVSQSAYLQSADQFLIAKERFDLGAINKPDLLRFQVTMLERNVDLTNARSAISNARRTLNSYLGIKSIINIDTVLAFPDTIDPIPSKRQLVDSILKINPSLKSSNLQIEANRQLRKSIISTRIPYISGSLNYGSFNTGLTNQFSDWSLNDYFSIGIQMNWNILDGGRWFGQLQSVNATTQILSASNEITRNTLIQELHQTIDNIHTSRATLSFVVALQKQSSEEYQLTVLKNQLGAASTLDILAAQLSYIQAQQRLAEAVINDYLLYAKLEQLMGTW
jgi:outer membrane protein